MKKKVLNKILAGVITLSVIFQGMTIPVFAEEAAEAVSEEGALEEASEATEEMPFEGEDMDSDGVGNTEIIMSSSVASNGKYIAAAFPDSFIPDGFYAEEVTHEDGRIELLRMNNDTAGKVVLTYLANQDATDGDFYFFDSDTGEVSDYLMLKDGDHFIVILDTADQIVAPAGFVKAGITRDGKSVNGWVIAKGSDGEKNASIGVTNPFAPVDVYAAGVDGLLNSTSDQGSEAEEAGSSSEDVQGAEDMQGDAAGAYEGAVSSDDDSEYTAPNGDFFLVYAIDDEGYVGFFLCDKERECAFMRYTAVNSGAPVLTGLQANATLLFIIVIVLAVFLLISIFVIVNMVIARRDDDYDDDEDDEDEDDLDSLRRKVSSRDSKRIVRDTREQRYQMGEELEDEPEVRQPMRRPNVPQGMPGEMRQPARRQPDMPQGAPGEMRQPVRRRPENPEEMRQPVRRRPDMPQGAPGEMRQPVRRHPENPGEMRQPQRRPQPGAEGAPQRRPQPGAEGAPQRRPQGVPVQRRRPVKAQQQNFDTDFNFEFIDNE